MAVVLRGSRRMILAASRSQPDGAAVGIRIQGRNVLFGMFGGKVPLRRGETRPGERPFLVARVSLNRSIVLEAAASAAGCVKFGSGGPSWISQPAEFVDVELR
jgi:hypothetical protein